MTITKALTPVAFAALLSMAAAPAHADQRHGGGRYHAAERGHVVVRGGGGYVRARSSYYRPYYYRPYYSFRPRVSLGFGLWMGYPVPYPYYATPYAYAPQYADPYAYGAPAPNYPPANYPSSNYPSQNYPSSNSQNYPSSSYPASNYPAQRPAPSVGVQGGRAQSEGGISFEITPENAEVFVDGSYAGTAGEFGPAAQPLDVAPGRHRVEVRAPGYRTTTFDADVQPGQVIPFQGTLQRN
jgi:PEGA domain